MAKKKEDERFPRTLYKKGGKFTWGHGKEYSSEVVENEEEFNAAVKAGWLDDFNEAIFGKEKVSKKTDIDEDF